VLLLQIERERITMELIVNLKLKRGNDSMYNIENTKNEITSWLEDLGFEVKELEVKEKA
tara:strand:- start:42 stop:218 length:177 start_codon:yes stop_codon:yes gene_type:complete